VGHEWYLNCCWICATLWPDNLLHLQYKEDDDESGLQLDELSDDDDDEISLSSNLSAEAAENVKAISVENAYMEVMI